MTVSKNTTYFFHDALGLTVTGHYDRVGQGCNVEKNIMHLPGNILSESLRSSVRLWHNSIRKVLTRLSHSGYNLWSKPDLITRNTLQHLRENLAKTMK